MDKFVLGRSMVCVWRSASVWCARPSAKSAVERDAHDGGLGWSIICLTRPFESIPPFVFTWLALAALVSSDRRRWRQWVMPLVLCASVQMMAGAITLLHDRAVTGTFFTLPYQLDQRGHGTPQSFLGQRAVEASDFRSRN
jgi:hypothetical protein